MRSVFVMICIGYASWGPTFSGTPRNTDRPAIKQLKEARKGKVSTRKGNRWRCKGNGPLRSRNRGAFELPKMPLIATVPLTALIVKPGGFPQVIFRR